jgi:hypothetical protein
MKWFSKPKMKLEEDLEMDRLIIQRGIQFKIMNLIVIQKL